MKRLSPYLSVQLRRKGTTSSHHKNLQKLHRRTSTPVAYNDVSRLHSQERLCLDAMIAKLNELGYDVGCKIYDGCLVRRKQQCKLPQRVITACEEHIEAVSGAFDRLT